MQLILLCSHFLMDCIHKEHCKFLPYNFTKLCSDPNFYLGVEGGNWHITTCKTILQLMQILVYQSKDLVERDALKEPQSERADVLLLLATGLSMNFKFARLCHIYFREAPLIAAEQDEHEYASTGSSLRQSFEADMPRPAAIPTSSWWAFKLR